MNDLERELSARLHRLADDLVGPGPAVSPADAVARYRHRRRTRTILVATAVAVVAIAVGVPTAAGSLSSAPADPAAPMTSTRAPAPLTTAPRMAPTTAPGSTYELDTSSNVGESAQQDAVHVRELAELQAAAAQLTSPVALSSPPEWDRWLPRGKPYPGASTAEDIATCPHLAAGLSTDLGVRMSYWTGTLPNGPVGCTWATVPLSYDGPYTYPYLLSVGYLADGSTVEDWRHHYYEHQGQICPDVDLPAAGEGAALVRCENDTTGYVLLVPDTRRDGVWFLQADTRAGAAHPAPYALTALVDAVRKAYG